MGILLKAAVPCCNLGDGQSTTAPRPATSAFCSLHNQQRVAPHRFRFHGTAARVSEAKPKRTCCLAMGFTGSTLLPGHELRPRCCCRARTRSKRLGRAKPRSIREATHHRIHGLRALLADRALAGVREHRREGGVRRPVVGPRRQELGQPPRAGRPGRGEALELGRESAGTQDIQRRPAVMRWCRR